jgi:transcriptional regulator with XRE-family HTH domain
MSHARTLAPPERKFAVFDVEQGVISRIENGRANPTLLVLETLATTREVRVEQLFEVQTKSRRAKDR